MNSSVSDLIEHAKCYTFEWLDCDYERFHRPDLASIFSDLEYDKEQKKNRDFLTTEQKLRMSNFGSLSELQKKEQAKLISLRIVMQSKVKLKTKQKSKIFYNNV